MLMAVNEPYALMVQPDDILISPREVDEHFGTMVCFHPRYALGDHHNHMDKDDFLREMYLDTVGHDEAGMKRYERMVNIVSSRFRHGPKTEERAIDEAMQKVISEKYLMRNGIPCLQKHCIRRTISNIYLIFFCMVHWKNEKHFRCEENGLLYVPGKNELFIYHEPKQKKRNSIADALSQSRNVTDATGISGGRQSSDPER